MADSLVGEKAVENLSMKSGFEKYSYSSKSLPVRSTLEKSTPNACKIEGQNPSIKLTLKQSKVKNI